MKIFKRIISIIIFISIFVLLLHGLSMAFIPNAEIASDVYNGFYELPKNSIDVEFIGDSSIYRGISPMEMYKQDGIAGYNLALTGARIKSVYEFFSDSLKYQKPKLVVMNTEFLYITRPQNKNLDKVNMQYQNTFKGKLVNVLKNDNNKFKSFDEKMKYLFPIFEFHDRWNETNIESLSKVMRKKRYVTRGFIPSNLVRPYKYDPETYNDDSISDKMPNNNFEYFLKILDLCKKNDIQVLFVTIPHPKIWNDARNKNMLFLAKTYNFKYLELDIHKTNINFLTDTKDAGNHLNTNGAVKLSKYLSTYIKENYKLPDRRKDKSYDFWNEDYEKYLKKIKRRPRKLRDDNENKISITKNNISDIQNEINNK